MSVKKYANPHAIAGFCVNTVNKTTDNIGQANSLLFVKVVTVLLAYKTVAIAVLALIYEVLDEGFDVLLRLTGDHCLDNTVEFVF